VWLASLLPHQKALYSFQAQGTDMIEICDVQMLAFRNDGGLFGGHQPTAIWMAHVQALAVSEVGCKMAMSKASCRWAAVMCNR
jgi:hypothetical protein